MVYIDDMFATLGRMKMCHMVADTDEELHKMAIAIGMRVEWWQSPANHFASHYDVSKQKRELAISLGAIPVTSRQCVALCKRKKITGVMGEPHDALAWYYANMEAKKIAKTEEDKAKDIEKK